MALNLLAPVSERITIHTQAQTLQTDDGTKVDLDYAFAEYQVSDEVTLRLGKVKHPFGIYTEVFTVGTLRPFIDLPQGFYGPVGFAGQAYNGAGITGSARSGEWTANYDVYGGGYTLEKFRVPEELYHGSSLQDVSQEIEVESTRNVIGGRVVLHTPVRGLSVGSSAYTGILDEPAANRRTVVAAQFDYRSNAWTLQSEVAYEDQVNDERAAGGYVQTAYRLTSEWQVAAQYDYLQNRFNGVSAAAAPSLQFHREGAVALNYWVSRSMVVKLEYHHVNGNRFAMPHPEDLVATLDAGRLRTVTHLVQFGAQFAF
ncbi:MAG: porin [bacterium]